MLDLQFGRHAWRAVALTCQVAALTILAGCEKVSPAANEKPPASVVADSGATQQTETQDPAATAPPDDFFRQCLRLPMYDGTLKDSSVGPAQVNELIAVLERNPNAVLTWGQDGDGSPILHDLITDRVAGTESTISLRFTDMGDAAPSDHCGPKQLVVTRVVRDGVELDALNKMAFVDKILIMARQ